MVRTEPHKGVAVVVVCRWLGEKYKVGERGATVCARQDKSSRQWLKRERRGGERDRVLPLTAEATCSCSFLKGSADRGGSNVADGKVRRDDHRPQRPEIGWHSGGAMSNL